MKWLEELEDKECEAQRQLFDVCQRALNVISKNKNEIELGSGLLQRIDGVWISEYGVSLSYGIEDIAQGILDYFDNKRAAIQERTVKLECLKADIVSIIDEQ